MTACLTAHVSLWCPSPQRTCTSQQHMARRNAPFSLRKQPRRYTKNILKLIENPPWQISKLCYNTKAVWQRNWTWGYSSAGRALEWHSRGQRFDPAYLHQKASKSSDFGAFFFVFSPKKYSKIKPLTSCGHLLPQLCHNWKIYSFSICPGRKNAYFSVKLQGYATISPQWLCVCLDFCVPLRPLRPSCGAKFQKSLCQIQEVRKYGKKRAFSSFFLIFS